MLARPREAEREDGASGGRGERRRGREGWDGGRGPSRRIPGSPWHPSRLLRLAGRSPDAP
eukprot:1864732-Pyramimonas_sp.AAC.1